MKPHSLLAPSNAGWLVTLLCAAPVAGQSQLTVPSNFPTDLLGANASGEVVLLSSVFKQNVRAICGSQTVRRLRHERFDAQSTWTEERAELPVDYWLTAICSRNGGDDLFVAGMRSNGDTVLERWTFHPKRGRYRVHYPGSPPTLGAPQDPYTPAIEVVGGGSWKWNAKIRNLAPKESNPHKTVLYEGAKGPFTVMEADPEGRFLLLYDYGAKELSRIVLNRPTVVLETLFSASTDPELDQLGSLEARDFGSPRERVYLLRRMEGDNFLASEQRYGILQDFDNDGEFDALNYLDVSEFEQSPFGQWDDWTLFWKLP